MPAGTPLCQAYVVTAVISGMNSAMFNPKRHKTVEEEGLEARAKRALVAWFGAPEAATGGLDP